MTKSETGSQKLNQLLSGMNAAGGFRMSVLTDKQGLSIASASANGIDPERQAAAVAFAERLAAQVTRQAGLGNTDELAFNYESGQRLICRMFQAGDHELILAVLVPPGAPGYRRATNRAIHEIKNTWKKFWAS